MKIERVELHLVHLVVGVLPNTAETDEPAIRRLLAENLSAFLPEGNVKIDAVIKLAAKGWDFGKVTEPANLSDWRTILFNFLAQARGISVNSGATAMLNALPTKCVDAFREWRASVKPEAIKAANEYLAKVAKEAKEKAEADKAKSATK